MDLIFPVIACTVAEEDWQNLSALPWGVPLEEWTNPEHGLNSIDQRRGLSRHPVLFVQAGSYKYAIKETTPKSAETEIANYQEIARRGCPCLVPVGSVVVEGELIPAGMIVGIMQYERSDAGYCVTRLATHVLPHSLLYQFPFTEENKQILLVAIARLLLTLHNAGVYWGDASLANTLINLGRTQLVALLADAETVEIFPGAMNEHMRQADIDFFCESLLMQSEDIRLARNLPEDETVLSFQDTEFFQSVYASLRMTSTITTISREIEQALMWLSAGVVDLGRLTWQAGISGVEATFRPGWYRDKLRDILGIWVPRAFARRVYELILVHKWLMSEGAGHDVGLAAAANDWRIRYHDPLAQVFATYAPGQQMDYNWYLRIMNHIWKMSEQKGRPVSIEEGAIDYLLPT